MEHSSKSISTPKQIISYWKLGLTRIEPDTNIPNKYTETIRFKKIKTENLTQERLYSIFQETNDRFPNITDIGEFFVYQYSNKPSVFISKEDGLLYGREDNYLTRLQGIFLLQRLNKFGLVEGYKRIRHIPRKSRMWLDD
jgi:hypothetical protein